ncbi:hypothetical protein CpecS_0548 [Chlamydia pecorum VR629]|nr:hypothetical protein CpecS_0548 [Chlamydia pecorum VR629]
MSPYFKEKKNSREIQEAKKVCYRKEEPQDRGSSSF